MAPDGHVRWMAHALALAERGRATCRPNPMVGCVLVRDGQLIGQGWHERAGGPHAEIHALTDAGDATGATAYVTLEPCNHHGRTGPCSVALHEAGVSEVVYALEDPHPVAAGGAAHLRDAGVAVTGGLMADWAAEQNLVFLTGVHRQRPHVTLKLAHTRAGELVAPVGRWITGQQARNAVHAARAHVDAVLVGSGTVVADDPRLDVRHVRPPGPSPRAVVLDRRGRTPATAQVVRPGTIVVAGPQADPAWQTSLQKRGCEVVVLATAPPDHLATVMHELWMRDIRAILAEPGATLAAELLAAGLVDTLITHVAATSPGSPFHDPPALSAAAQWPVRRMIMRGDDLELERRPARTTRPPKSED